MKISDVRARWILDSRGNPTIEVDVITADGALGRAAVPSGASTGSREALELRDGGQPFGGKGVGQAVRAVTDTIAPAILGHDVGDQAGLDQLMIDLDGTPNKQKLGANAILGVSLAAAKAAAITAKQPLYQYIGRLAGNHAFTLPLPQMNIINGGAHASGALDIQEVMIIPIGAKTFPDALRMGTEVFHHLGKLLKSASYPTTVGDEGGYAPPFKHGFDEAVELVLSAINGAGYQAGTDIALGLDIAASQLINNDHYRFAGQILTSTELIDWYEKATHTYPIISLEDGLSENDWGDWTKLTDRLGANLQLVGDDLFVTNTELLKRGIAEDAANAILIKLNQIGTLTETIAAVTAAQAAGWRTVISHRSGETEDTTIAHLAVGLNAGQIKTGSLSRTERTAKYNELLRIGETVPDFAQPFVNKA